MKSLTQTKPIIMAVVNVTPDSFSDGGKFSNLDTTLRHIESCVHAGADIIDVGAESTRPGSAGVSAELEMERLAPLLECFKAEFDVDLSVDTSKAAVARFALECGADMINDVTALDGDSAMLEVLAVFKPAVCLMHMLGIPETMQDNPVYDDVVERVYVYLKNKVQLCRDAGIENVVVDPGIGFGKRIEHNLALLRDVERFVDLGCPVMVGTSRKSFIDRLSPSDVSQRIGGSIASNLAAWQRGARVFRVHDVFELKQAFRVFQAIEEGVEVGLHA